MPVHPLPPQAYTKETLQKAYTWLLTQNPSVKEMASTQDILVSLYLKAQRNGAESLDTPSIQNFKQELKSLANMMGDFQTAAQSTTNASMPAAGHSHLQPNAIAAPAPQSTFIPPVTTHAPPISSNEPSLTQQQAAGIRAATPTNLQNLDPVTLQYLAEAKAILNLSSDSEVLRAVVSLGYRQLKKI